MSHTQAGWAEHAHGSREGDQGVHSLSVSISSNVYTLVNTLCHHTQWPMLKQRWLIILFGIIMQYVHGIFTQLAHRMHHPQELPLHDVGFDLTPVSVCV